MNRVKIGFFSFRCPVLIAPRQWLAACAAKRVLVHLESIPNSPNRGIDVIVKEPTSNMDTDWSQVRPWRISFPTQVFTNSEMELQRVFSGS